jgi:hypothetical protein
MLKEEGSKKSKDLFKDIGQTWHKNSDECINKIKDNNLSYNCKKILDCVQDLLSEEQRERFAILAENDNGHTLEEPMCEYDSMLLQLAMCVEKNQKLKETKCKEANR